MNNQKFFKSHSSCKHIILLCGCLLSAMTLPGCATERPIPTQTVFTNGYHSFFPSMLYYTSPADHLPKALDYSSMESSVLCEKPNCRHNTEDCLVQRMNASIPLIADHYAYYFSDDLPEYYENDAGKADLKIGSTLFCRDLNSGKETGVLRIDDSSVDPHYGWLLHDGYIYYVANHLARNYDENGNLISTGSTGGSMSLCRADLTTGDSVGLCPLYDIDALSKYYPDAPNSAEAYLVGLFDQKLYFNIAFAECGDQWDIGFIYRFYVTYYDLTDGTYHGTPDDYTNIDFASVRYVSDDYLVICRDGTASVYKTGSDQPVILEDSCLNPDAFLSAFEGTLYCGSKAFDLQSKAVRTIDFLDGKSVVTKYGDSYIISDLGMQRNFEKIQMSNLMSCVELP